MPYGSPRTLVFWCQQTLVGLIPPEICAQSDPPPFEHNNFGQYLLIMPQPWELAKNVQLALAASHPHTSQWAIDEPCTLPIITPNGGTKRDFAVFACKIQLLSIEVRYKVSFCENLQRHICSYIISLSNGP